MAGGQAVAGSNPAVPTVFRMLVALIGNEIRPSGNDHDWLSQSGASRASRTATGECGLMAAPYGKRRVAVRLVGGLSSARPGRDWRCPKHSDEVARTVRQAAREIYRRLMDAVDPALVDQVEQALRATPGVLGVGQVRLRWIGHHLRAECEVIVDAGASAVQAHQVAVSAEHNLLHVLPRLSAALVHADPQAQEGTDHHAALASHR